MVNENKVLLDLGGGQSPKEGFTNVDILKPELCNTMV